MATSHGTATRESSLLLSATEWAIMGGAGALALLNVLLMIAVSFTPLVQFVWLVYSIPILGVVVYGALLGGGEWIAKKGTKEESMGLAFVGVAVLQFAFATFGGAILTLVGPFLRLVATGITAVVTVAITVVVGAYVYYRSDTEFDHWRWISAGAFLVGTVGILAGMFLHPLVYLASFALYLLGFVFLLGWEIYQVRDRQRGSSPAYHSIGIYVAFMGVFVHILRIVVQLLGVLED